MKKPQGHTVTARIEELCNRRSSLSRLIREISLERLSGAVRVEEYVSPAKYKFWKVTYSE